MGRDKAKNLWNFLLDPGNKKIASPLDYENEYHGDVSECMFNGLEPKKHIQVRRTLVNNGSSIIAVFSDVTRIKELEKTS